MRRINLGEALANIEDSYNILEHFSHTTMDYEFKIMDNWIKLTIHREFFDAFEDSFIVPVIYADVYNSKSDGIDEEYLQYIFDISKFDVNLDEAKQKLKEKIDLMERIK